MESPGCPHAGSASSIAVAAKSGLGRGSELEALARGRDKERVIMEASKDGKEVEKERVGWKGEDEVLSKDKLWRWPGKRGKVERESALEKWMRRCGGRAKDRGGRDGQGELVKGKRGERVFVGGCSEISEKKNGGKARFIWDQGRRGRSQRE